MLTTTAIFFSFFFLKKAWLWSMTIRSTSLLRVHSEFSFRVFIRFLDRLRDIASWLHARGQIMRHASDPGSSFEFYRRPMLLGLLLPLKQNDVSYMIRKKKTETNKTWTKFVEWDSYSLWIIFKFCIVFAVLIAHAQFIIP